MVQIKTLIVSTVFLASSAFAGAKYQAGNYSVDVAHSKVGFEVSHLVISSVEGNFKTFEGKIVMADKFEASTVEASADIASINTDNADRDKHLQSPDFFDGAKFPKMTLKSKKISGKPEKFKMTADLTMHGVTKEVTFEGKYIGTAVDPWGNTKAGFSATGKINRKDFGLNWTKVVEAGPVVGDEITISLKIEAAKDKEAAK